MKRRILLVACVYVVLGIAITGIVMGGDPFSGAEASLPEYMQPYYSATGVQTFGKEKLEDFLQHRSWLSSRYQRSVFDCSEMSAYLEAQLEADGWHTYIAVGLAPFNPDVRHAWLLVEVEPGTFEPVEATVPELVRRSTPSFNGYFEYDHLFESIDDSLKYKAGEFDWWNSIGVQLPVQLPGTPAQL